jgi:hypothetical protein
VPCGLFAAVVEALQVSPYAGKVHVVAGEADPVCAALALAVGGLIFTTDSDLLAFDIGSSGVVLLRDLRCSGAEGATVLHADVYHTGRIARRLGLQSLTPLGFAVYSDRFRSLDKLVAHAKLVCEQASKAYDDFETEYSARGINAAKPGVHCYLRLDRELSEWLHALRSDEPLEMYLHILADDPLRRNTWSLSMPLRQLTYSLLRPSKDGDPAVTVEHQRKHLGIAPIDVVHLNDAELAFALGQARQMVRRAASVASETRWRAAAGFWIVEQRRDMGALPTREAIGAVLACSLRVRGSWALMALDAEVQALLLSWRMLVQCLQLIEDGEVQVSDEVHQDCKTLLRDTTVLGGLSVVQMFDSDDCIDWRVVVGGIYNSLGIAEETVEPPKPKKKKRKGTHKRTSSNGQRAEQLANNRYSILALEE